MPIDCNINEHVLSRCFCDDCNLIDRPDFREASPVRINLVSDLHTDIAGNGVFVPPDVDADVTVVAGDAMAPGTIALRKVRDLYPDRRRPTIYVAGNHDFYSDPSRSELKTTFARQRAEMPAVAADLGIILLDDSTVEIDGIRFIGATLWTDFSARPGYLSFADAVREAASSRGMNDYRMIKTGKGRSKDKLQPRDTINAHKVSRIFIERTLAEPFVGDTVVITHHAPSYRSLLLSGMTFDNMDWCYASNLEHLMVGDNAPALWLHGHIHANRDYVVGNTRVVSNPRGYPLRAGVRENPDFDPGLVVDLEPKPVHGMRI